MRLSDVMSHAGLAIYAEIALVLFFLVFLAIVLRLWLRRDRQELERMSRLPLEDESRESPEPGARP